MQPPLEYAVRKVVSALSNTGHEGELTKFHNKSASNSHLVFEWNTSEHARGWDLWLKGVLADGGRRCRLQCEKENEPLIEGMLVGEKKDELNVVEGEEVRASRLETHNYITDSVQSRYIGRSENIRRSIWLDGKKRRLMR